MKKRFSRLLALLLALCLSLSCFSVFAFAEGESEEEETEIDESLKIGLNRTFDEGWDYTNGIPGSLTMSTMKLDYERGYDLKYNYYFYVECHSGENEYIQLDATQGSSGDGYTFLEFDMKVSENCSINQFFQAAPATESINIIGFKDGQLVICGKTIPKEGDGSFYMRGDEWVSVSLRFNMGYSTEMKYVESVSVGDIEVVATITREGDPEPFVHTVIVTDRPTIDERGFNTFRIGFMSDAANTARIGQYYAIDNLRYYSHAGKDPIDLDPAVYGYGDLVNATLDKTYPILGGETVAISRDQIYSDSLFMKVGLEYALYKEQRTALLFDIAKGEETVRTPLVTGHETGAYGAPVKYNGDNEAYKGLIMIPLEPVLEYIGYPVYEHEDGASYDISTGTSSTYLTIGRDTATVGGATVQLKAPPQIIDDGVHQYPVIALEDVEALFPGFYVTYDKMGLIAISIADNVFDRTFDLEWMTEIMKDFVFYYAKEDDIYEMVEEHTNGFEHPYLYTNGERFDELHALYTKGLSNPESLTADELQLWGYMDGFVRTNKDSANRILSTYADFDEDGNYRGFRDIRAYEKYASGSFPKIQLVNAAYEPVYDTDGNPVYVTDNYIYQTQNKLDENGNPIQAVDGKGNPLTQKDENGVDVPVYVQEKIPVTDKDGNIYTTYNEQREKVPVYKKVLSVRYDYFQAYIGGSPVEPHPQTDNGYDPEGERFTVPSSYLDELAFAYAVTRDTDYAYLAYDWIMELGDLNHWGPGHFLNCADGSKPVAMAIDWMYNAFEDKEGNNLLRIPYRKYDFTDEVVETITYTESAEGARDVDDLIAVLYEKGTYMGIRCAKGLRNYWTCRQDPSPYNWGYRKHTNNWSAVCTSGMVMAALITMDYDRDGDGKNSGEGDYFTLKNPVYKEEGFDKENLSVFLIEDHLNLLATNGLGQYAPDGSYCESAGYWSYGTNSLFDFIICLESATGTDFGYMRSWGLDTTCYFATHAEDSNRVTWGYHDGGDGVDYENGKRISNGLPSHFFTWVGQYLGDLDLCRIRKIQIDGGKSVSIYDCLYFNYFEEGDVDLPLTYHMEGIDGFAIRSSWEKNSMYVGMMGGKNTVPHGQIDAGAFVYRNAGVVWMCDLGADNYNVKNYFGNNGLYRKNGEGSNNFILAGRPKEVPHGQHASAAVPLIEKFTNEYGAYAIFDMASCFKGYINDSKRGVYVTNDYKTVVIQDETHTTSIEKMYWIGHYDTNSVSEVKLSEDERTAYLFATNNEGDEVILRMSIVSSNARDRFKDIDTYHDYLGNEGYILDSTLHPTWSTENGGTVDEKDRPNIRRLVIERYGFGAEMAVVFEMVDVINSPDPVGYEYIPMAEWGKEENLPHRDTRFDNVVDEGGLGLREEPNFLKMKEGLVQLEKVYDKDPRSFNSNLYTYYRVLTDFHYNYSDFIGMTGEDVAKKHDKIIKKYDKFAKEVNATVKDVKTVVDNLLGI